MFIVHYLLHPRKTLESHIFSVLFFPSCNIRSSNNKYSINLCCIQDWLHNLWIQCKVKIQVPSFENYCEFHDGHSRALNQAWAPSECGTLCACADCMAMKSALVEWMNEEVALLSKRKQNLTTVHHLYYSQRGTCYRHFLCKQCSNSLTGLFVSILFYTTGVLIYVDSSVNISPRLVQGGDPETGLRNLSAAIATFPDCINTSYSRSFHSAPTTLTLSSPCLACSSPKAFTSYRSLLYLYLVKISLTI